MHRNKGIFARIKFVDTDGITIKYIYEKKQLEELSLIPDSSESNQTYMNIGDKIEIEGESFKILKILTKFFPKTYGEDENYDNYVPYEPLPCNFQITYVVG